MKTMTQVDPDYVLFTRTKAEARRRGTGQVHAVATQHVRGATVTKWAGSHVLTLDVDGWPGSGSPATEPHAAVFDEATAHRLHGQLQMHARGDEATPHGSRLPDDVAQKIGQAVAQAGADMELKRSNRKIDVLTGFALAPLILAGLLMVVAFVAVAVGLAILL